MKRYRLPPTFYYDHVYRDLPEEGETRVVHETKSKVTVEMDAPAYDDLLSDADFYSTQPAGTFGPELFGLTRSAAATKRALVEQGRP